jgi:hypothetical protein
VPECDALIDWAKEMPVRQSKSLRQLSPAERIKQNEEYEAFDKKANEVARRALSDDVMTSVFGAPLSEWGRGDKKTVVMKIGSCSSSWPDENERRRLNLLAGKSNRFSGTVGDKLPAYKQKDKSSALTDPGCERMNNWASKAGTKEKSISVANRQAMLFTDADTQALFGMAFSQWSGREYAGAQSFVSNCFQEIRKQDDLMAAGLLEAYEGLRIASFYLAQQIRTNGYNRQ